MEKTHQIVGDSLLDYGRLKRQHNNLVVTWKVRPWMGIISWAPLVCWFFRGGYSFPLANKSINMCPQKQNTHKPPPPRVQLISKALHSNSMWLGLCICCIFIAQVYNPLWMNKNTSNNTEVVKCVHLPYTGIPASGHFMLESTTWHMNIAHQMSNIIARCKHPCVLEE